MAETTAGAESEVEDLAAPAPSPWLFWRFLGGSTVSNAGDAVTSVAVPLLAVLTLHASAFAVSLLTAATFGAWTLIGLPAGAIVSRLPLRATQIAMDLLRAAAIGSIPVASALGVLSLPQLYAVVFLVALASVVFTVANSTFLPALVSPEELLRRNRITSTSESATTLGGPALGGVLVQVLGAGATVIVDAVSYLVSAVTIRSLPKVDISTPGRAAMPARALIAAGVRQVVKDTVIGPCVAAAVLLSLATGSMMSLLAVYLVRVLHASPGQVGVVFAADGVGVLLGAALLGWFVKRFGTAGATVWATAGGAVCLVAVPAASSGWGLVLIGVGLAGYGAGVTIFSILTRTHRQTVVPLEELPRVTATVRFLSWGAAPVGAVAVGAGSLAAGVRPMLVVSLAFAFAAPLVLWASPVRRLRDLDQTDSAAPRKG